MRTFFEQLRVGAEGTAIGLAGRAMTWPLELAVYRQAEKTSSKSLFKIYSEMCTKTAFGEIYLSFAKTGFTQTIGKAGANLGVLHYINHYHRDLTPILKGLFAASLSAPLESLLTSRGEYRKVQSFYQANLNVAKMDRFLFDGFSRVLTANFIRNFPTSVFTFGGMYFITDLVKPLFPASKADSAIAKGVSASFANILIQPLNMPFINFQTHVLRDPSQTTPKAVQSFFRENTVKQLFKGTSARIIHRSIFYGLTFAASTYLDQLRNSGNNPTTNIAKNTAPRKP